MTKTHSSRPPIGRSRFNRDEIVGRRNGGGAAGVSTGLLSALYLLPAVAQAGVVHVTGSPFTLSLTDPVGTTVSWDVDGINGPEFELFRASFGGSQSIQIASVNAAFAPLNGRGFVGPNADLDDVQALPAGASTSDRPSRPMPGESVGTDIATRCTTPGRVRRSATT